MCAPRDGSNPPHDEKLASDGTAGEDVKWAAKGLVFLAYLCVVVLTALLVVSHRAVTDPLGVEPGMLPVLVGSFLVLFGSAVSLWEAITQTKRWSSTIGSGLTTAGALTALVLALP